ncbi:hypothetical protein MOC51_01405 [Bacillus inaquosorum]|nr:hypothetical protein [Bacillus inaquosorum]
MTESIFAEEPIGETTVKKIEKALDIKFPSDYVTTTMGRAQIKRYLTLKIQKVLFLIDYMV